MIMLGTRCGFIQYTSEADRSCQAIRGKRGRFEVLSVRREIHDRRCAATTPGAVPCFHDSRLSNSRTVYAYSCLSDFLSRSPGHSSGDIQVLTPKRGRTQRWRMIQAATIPPNMSRSFMILRCLKRPDDSLRIRTTGEIALCGRQSRWRPWPCGISKL